LNEDAKQSLPVLLDLLRAVYRSAQGDAPSPVAATLAQVLQEMDRFPKLPSPCAPGRRLPSCRHLGAALESAVAGPHAQLGSAFAALEPFLKWMQNPNYTGGQGDRAFLDNYAYCDFLGPRGLAKCGDLAMGCLLLGPGTLYADHAHPAVEIYLLLSGPAEWRLDGGAWVVRSAGSLIHHASGQVHAMRAGDTPLLLLYAWLGHLDTPASMTTASPETR